MRKYFLHFTTIKKDPIKFIIWILLSVVLALSAVWVPSLYGKFIGHEYFFVVLENNPVVVFSVVFLANVIASASIQPGLGSNKFASNLRTLTFIVIWLYVIFITTLLPIKVMNNISLSPETQLKLLVITLTLGIYAYGFREAEWEKTVDQVMQKENREVADITKKASEKKEEGGVKL